MMLATLFALTFSASAASQADLSVSISAPSPEVEAEATYSVTVANVGNRSASDVVLTIQLPETNTSPTVYLMGVLGAYDGSCARSGTALVCNLGRIRNGRSSTVSFDLALPWSNDPLVIDASATTSSTESSTANNDDSAVVSLSYVDVVIVGPQDVTNRHCTGTGLAAFYECTLFPSSISTHDATLNADGSISFIYPGYGGSWYQSSDDHLHMTYTYGTDIVAEFEGNGVDSSCFEGLTTFPGSTYVSPYEVCLN